MKFSHILLVVAIAIATGVILSTAGNASQYVTFSEASSIAQNGDKTKVHVIGELIKDQNNHVMGLEYNPSLNPNYLSFMLKDDKSEAKKVVCYSPPASMRDFEKSEKVVVVGSMRDGVFVASEILMKCPSKYEEKTIKS